MIYGNFIIPVITVSEEKIGGVTFVPPVVIWRMAVAI